MAAQIEPPMNDNTTILSVLQDRMLVEHLVLQSGKLYKTCEDLMDQVFDYSALQDLTTFPTCFFVLPTTFCKSTLYNRDMCTF
jgi:hypothetical protein